MSRLKECLVRFRIWGHHPFRNLIIKLEGGEMVSSSLREVTRKDNLVDVDMYSYGCCFSRYFNLGGSVTIGRYCSFATDIHYFGANHPTWFASTSPYFYNPSLGMDVVDVKREHLVIGNDVWCGYGVIITNKCHRIGNGAVIAAGSIVTSDIPPYAVVMGNPARIKRYRFDEETINLLEKSRWYDLSPRELMNYYCYIDNPKKFAVKIMDNDNKENPD